MAGVSKNLAGHGSSHRPLLSSADESGPTSAGPPRPLPPSKAGNAPRTAAPAPAGAPQGPDDFDPETVLRATGRPAPRISDHHAEIDLDAPEPAVPAPSVPGSSPLAHSGPEARPPRSLVLRAASVPLWCAKSAFGIARTGVACLLSATWLAWCVRSLFGIASLVVLLAVVAAIPGVNILALGYLLEVEGRVARSGRLRDAFPLIDLAPRLGSIALGVLLCVFPLQLLAGAAADARLINPGSTADRNLHLLVQVASIVLTLHLCLALARGGSLTCFIRPIKNLRWLSSRVTSGQYWTQAEAAVRDFLSGWRLKYHFWLGFRGYAGALLWLVLPTALFASATKTEGLPLFLMVIGGVLLMLVLSWVPFLQAHYAAENRWGAMFELRKVRALYRHAPFSWLVTLLVTLALSLPLYLFTIVLPPGDVAWLVTLVFIVSIYPARVVTGWAYHRAVTRERPAPRLLLVFTRLLTVPLLGFYVFLLFFTQLIGERGKAVLFEHHAFMLPSPF